MIKNKVVESIISPSQDSVNYAVFLSLLFLTSNGHMIPKGGAKRVGFEQMIHSFSSLFTSHTYRESYKSFI